MSTTAASRILRGSGASLTDQRLRAQHDAAARGAQSAGCTGSGAALDFIAIALDDANAIERQTQRLREKACKSRFVTLAVALASNSHKNTAVVVSLDAGLLPAPHAVDLLIHRNTPSAERRARLRRLWNPLKRRL